MVNHGKTSYINIFQVSLKGKTRNQLSSTGCLTTFTAFIGLRPSMPVSDLVRDIKNNSTNFINDEKLVRKKFTWQDGYGVFSYSHSQIESVYNYILNQEKHHKKKTFREEYIDFLNKFAVEYNEKYLFDWIN